MKRYLLLASGALIALIVLFLVQDRFPAHRRAPRSERQQMERSAERVSSAPRTISANPERTEPKAQSRVSERPSVTSEAGISEPIKKLLETKSKHPTVSMIGTLGRNDEAVLVNLYLKETELTNKCALTWALAAVGSDAAATAFKETLTMDYNGRVMTLPEWKVMADTLEVMGFIASRSNNAYDFVLEALSEDFWKRHRLWQAPFPQEEAYANTRFVGLAVHSLGASGRPGASEKLSELSEANPDAIGGIVGPIATAAFYYEIAKEKGSDTLLKYHLSHMVYEEYQRWTETENGRKWHDWSMRVRRVAPR